MKKYNFVLVAILLVVIGFSVGYIFRDTTKPDAEVIEQSQSMEVYEEFAADKLLEIQIDTVNVNLQVLPSENRNIRIIYRPSAEPSNFIYHIENKIMYMQVDEVDASSSMVPSNREMIYLYLPNGTDVTLRFTSNTGFLDVDSVNLRNLYVSTKSGIVALSHADITLNASVETVSGKVVMKEIDFENLSVKTNTALVSCALSSSGSQYQQLYQTEEGKITVNGETVGKTYEVVGEEKQRIELRTRSGAIRVKIEEIVEDEE